MEQNQEIILILKALADPIRFELVQQVAKSPEVCACQLIEEHHITQPTLSFHMKKLVQSGLVSVHKDGLWMKYQINHEKLEMVQEALNLRLSKKPVLRCRCD